MNGILIALIIGQILISVMIGLIAFKFFKIEDFIAEKIMRKQNSLIGNSNKSTQVAIDKAKEDIQNLYFEVPELKTLFPELHQHAMVERNDPSLIATGLAGGFLGQAAPFLLQLFAREEISFSELLVTLAPYLPKFISYIRERREAKTKKVVAEDGEIRIQEHRPSQKVRTPY